MAVTITRSDGSGGSGVAVKVFEPSQKEVDASAAQENDEEEEEDPDEQEDLGLDLNQLLSSCPNVSIKDIVQENGQLGQMSLMELMTHIQMKTALPGLGNLGSFPGVAQTPTGQNFLDPNLGQSAAALRRPSYDTVMMRGRVINAGIPFRKCNCKGNIHTCMSPMTSEVQSMIHTPYWGRSLHQSQVASISQSRDNSSSEEEQEKEKKPGSQRGSLKGRLKSPKYKYTVKYNFAKKKDEDSSPSSSAGQVEEETELDVATSNNTAFNRQKSLEFVRQRSGSLKRKQLSPVAANASANSGESASPSGSSAASPDGGSPNGSKTLGDLWMEEQQDFYCPEVPDQPPMSMNDALAKKALKKKRDKFKRIQKSAMMRPTSPIPEETETSSPDDSRRGSQVVNMGGAGGGLALGGGLPQASALNFGGMLGGGFALNPPTQGKQKKAKKGKKNKKNNRRPLVDTVHSSMQVLAEEDEDVEQRDAMNSPGSPTKNNFEQLTHLELAALIEQKEPGLLVIDVRGRDFCGGNVPGARNMRTRAIQDDPESLIEELVNSGVRHVVFTCMYSVLRAITVAGCLSQSMSESKQKMKLHKLATAAGSSGTAGAGENKEDVVGEGAGAAEQPDSGSVLDATPAGDVTTTTEDKPTQEAEQSVETSKVDASTKNGEDEEEQIPVEHEMSAKMPTFRMSILKEGFHGWLNFWRGRGLTGKWVENYDATKWVEQEGTEGKSTFVHVMDAVWSDKGHQLLVNALQEIAADRERW
ncbi:unnamed protein product [Amoebophrya sp. A25]|nr:unnamed protein product [Amoebophrya sp. A25]|eukprot:GSA25T00020789001.1